jgi:hypothetical protein
MSLSHSTDMDVSHILLTQLPSDKEINQCWWITFTSDAEWQPYSDHFSKADKAAKNYF